MYVHCKFRPKLLQTFAIKNLMRNAKGFFFNSRAMDYSGRKVDLCHEVLMYQFSYLLYDKIFGSLQTSITPNIRSQSMLEQWRFKGTHIKEHEIINIRNKKFFHINTSWRKSIFFPKQSLELVAMEVVWDKSFPSRKWGLEAIFFQKQRTAEE